MSDALDAFFRGSEAEQEKTGAEERAAGIKKRARKKAVVDSAGRIPMIWVVRGEEFYSKKEAAEQFGVTPQTIARWCKGGGGVSPRENCSYRPDINTGD